MRKLVPRVAQTPAADVPSGWLLDEIVREGARGKADAYVNAPHLVALVRAGARFHNGKLVERAESACGMRYRPGGTIQARAAAPLVAM